MIAAHVHPHLVVAPAELRDQLLRHDVRQRQTPYRGNDRRGGEKGRLFRRGDLRGRRADL